MESWRGRLVTLGALTLLVAAVVAGTAGPAAANQVHVYSVNAVNPAANPTVNGAIFYTTGKTTEPNGPFGPVSVHWAFTPAWTYTSTTSPIWRILTWSGGPTVAPGASRYFTQGVRVPGQGCVPTATYCWGRWTLNGVPTGPAIPGLGWRFSTLFVAAGASSEGGGRSTMAEALVPFLFNSATLPDGTPNFDDLVVRNLQFAPSPRRVHADSSRLDNATVQQIFSNSSDTVRPGPFTVSPGGELQITGVHSSILNPRGPANGGLPSQPQAIFIKGTVAAGAGQQHDFVYQLWDAPPVPGAPPWMLLVASLGLAGLGMLFVRRRSRQFA